MKSSGEQIDDRIVEVHWDPAASHWRMMRFRDDKPNGNYRNVVDNIIQSIAEGVEKDTVRHKTYYSNISQFNIYYFTFVSALGTVECYPRRLEDPSWSAHRTSACSVQCSTTSTY